ncbi:GNAT family N-acetyltransferase [Silicimonas sp. MF1-12-2]|uniref:GNAT family N-acetyltransferase n=1 Tax=Silicimonas sp. MF1-12-2 TaxID=3384793 RepID=UPI0039B622D6
MLSSHDHLEIRLAESEADRRAAERLRYRVFVEELGGDGPLVDHEERFERDRFDEVYDHLVLVDTRRDADALDHVVGVYRLMPGDRAAEIGGFYSEDEYDLSVLKSSGRRLLELGRSCVHQDYRDGLALLLLWNGLGDYVRRNRAEILFGVASFHGTDIDALALPLAHLHHAHLAPPELRVRARDEVFQRMDLVPPERIDRVAAMRAVPSLIKSYLRLGGFVGDGAFVDRVFNTTDVCLVLDTVRLSDRDLRRFSGGAD